MKTMFFKRCYVASLCLLAAYCIGFVNSSVAQAQQMQVQQGSEVRSDFRPAEQNRGDVDLIWGVRIPLRDGVHLNATVYKPHDQKEPLPVIFVMTPYVADHDHSRAMYFAQNGYVFALVDVRGRGNSEGEFEPHVRDGADGYDAVEWLAKQPWSNGKVAMWGGSYMGFVQWTTIKELPPHLATMVPTSAPHLGLGLDTPAPGGIFTSDEMSWMADTLGRARNQNLGGDDDFWKGKYRQVFVNHLPFRQLEQISGFSGTAFQTELAHPSYDDFWKSMAPAPEQYAKMTIPILTIVGGIYDGNQPGGMSYYREHMQYGNLAARQDHYLVIGPWNHPGTRTPSREFNGLTFGEASVVDLNNLHKQWYDWTMKNGPRPDFLKKRVAYYVAGPGAENWKYADDLENIATNHQKLFLTSPNGDANDVFHSGGLSPKVEASAPDHYSYDPLNVDVVEEGGNFTSQRSVLNMNKHGLVYTSQAFPDASEITGYVRVTLWMEIDVPDTDFHVVLYDILPDGSSILLTEEYLRARYRDSMEKEKLVTPREITRYEMDKFKWFSRRISKGSRLRLFVTSPNSIFLEKNYNSGGMVADESGKDARVAHITLYHDDQHQSVVELPIGR